MRKTLLPILFLLPAALLFSQQYSFESSTISDGLAQSTVYCIEQDSRGYLWLGTDGGGLCRFDGTGFKTYTTSDGLSGNIVRSLLEDRRGKLWIGTNNGLDVYDGRDFNLRDSAAFSGLVVLSLLEDHNNNIWAGTSKGAYRISGNGREQGNGSGSETGGEPVSIERFTVEEGLITDLVFDVHEDAFHRIWLASWGGISLISFEEDTFRIEQFRQYIHIPGSQITSIAGDNEGFLWFGSLNSGVFRLKPAEEGFDELEMFNVDLGLNDNHVWDILADHAGSIWIASNEGGVNRYSAGVFHYFTEKEGMPTNQVQCLFEDKEQNLWIGTNGHGLCRFKGQQFSHFSQAEGLPESNVSSVTQDRDGNYWLATYGGGLVKMLMRDGKPEFRQFSESGGLMSDYLTAVRSGNDGEVWFSYAQSGIGKLENGTIRNYSRQNGLASDFVNCLYIDRNGELWCGTKGGVSNLNERGFLNFNESQLSGSEVQAILEDKYGDVWFGTLEGLSRFERSSRLMYRYDEQEGLANKRIHSLAECANGNIWIGTSGGGIFVFDRSRPDSMPVQPVANGGILSSVNIFSLVFLNDSTLVAGTDKGFDRITLDRSGNIHKVRNYNETDGFASWENNLNALCRDREGHLWFGTVGGLTRYAPELEKINMQPPRLHITELKIWFEETDWSSRGQSDVAWFNIPASLKLRHGDNHITFTISGISHSNPSKVRYRYMLEGLGANWSPALDSREVVYQGLKPGKYTFHVIAGNADGHWNNEPLSYAFTIKPPFWRTFWFLAAMIVLAGLGIVLWVKWREEQLRKKNRELEVKVAERTEEIRIQKDIIELKNRDITDSIKYAKRIQDALLPSQEVLEQNLSDSFIMFRPRDIVSGDFYWVRRKDSRLIIVAADCTGHGVPGAFMSMLGISFLDEIVDKDNILEPAPILERLRKAVISALKQHDPEAEAKDGMDMALCSIELGGDKLMFAGAHNSAWLFREGEVTELKADRMPVAIHRRLDEFTTHSLDLKKGDTIYLFSDGFPDQFGGPRGKKYKYRPFQELLLGMQDSDMETQKGLLEEAFNEWKGELDQVDDVVILGIRY
jgi:ligand-binding sensor domain-containing protein/serine phosphatase RsbU (regulator of sigma subunit)